MTTRYFKVETVSGYSGGCSNRLGVRRNETDRPGSVSQYIHEELKPGSVLLGSDPNGVFTLDTAGDHPVALISAGVGITPMLCMLKALALENPSREVWFAHGTRNAMTHAYASEVRRLTDRSATARSHVRFTKPRPGEFLGRDYDSIGRIDLDLIKENITKGYEVYLCGPNQFMVEISDGLKAWGLPEDRIHFESFGLGHAGTASNIGLIGAKVSFQGTEKVAVWGEQSTCLLELAEQAGVQIMNSCRSGACGSCEQKLISGSVDYHVQPLYPVSEQHVLMCCAQPTSDVKISST